jgi:UDP-N-acetylmuramate dehydrogenase
MNILQDYSLKSHNTFKIDTHAQFFVDLDGTSDVYELLSTEMCNDLPWMVIGEGSNILFTQDFEGLIIHLKNTEIQVLSESDRTIRIRVGAGVSWNRFVNYCIQNQYWGPENLVSIPGTVGSAPFQNIGAYGMEVGRIIESVQGIFPDSGEMISIDAEECQFSYRTSIFKTTLKNRFIITSVLFKLHKIPRPILSYEPLDRIFSDPASPELRAIADTISGIRQQKLPDPARLGNAGSFFKNPEVPEKFLKLLQINDPNIPFFSLPGNRFKVPAAWLIEKAGWKGKRIGQVGVYKRHALVLVNHGGATGPEILEFSNMIIDSVYRHFNIGLEYEVQII